MKLKVWNDDRCIAHAGGFGSMQRLTHRFLDVNDVCSDEADLVLRWNDALTTVEEMRACPKKQVLYMASNFTDAFSGGSDSYFRKFNWTTAELVAEADAILHTSLAHREFLLRFIAPDAHSKLWQVFPPMFNPAVFHPAPTRPGPLRVVAVALWRDWHRWITIFQAFSIVLRRMPSARLIVGGGYMGADIHRQFNSNIQEAQKSFAEELHILDAIDWRPAVGATHAEQDAHIAETFRMGNVFVHAYFADWGTFTCVEALASGLPVVCGDNGGLPEFAGDCGFQFKYGAGYDSPTMPCPNPAEVAAQILLAYSEGDDLRRRCIARAKQFEAAKVCAALEGFLRKVAQ